MKQKSWISIVFSFASQCRGKIALSVLCAIISVVAGLMWRALKLSKRLISPPVPMKNSQRRFNLSRTTLSNGIKAPGS